ncbi:hypothetical protein HBH64_016500 [Parastagonospora nodorum]|nr:hypothetical protein HBH53_169020 [Parastagonospora nodorum]KAH4042253.1 hypothetical protein HBI09_010540 [Parastagonospora nodorum]KAH4111447.1 hypothetical protein HBH46_010220 [Parastagonospora nodorum]KAH4200006.1 hypothetical protein HBH42_038550 [Parastagonospora nodorum]KAH4298780.1 hypothetical protein HBI01_125600 [Parastagonospora nodorum]
MRHHAAQDSTKSGAPIAQVLNDTDPIQDATNPSSTSHVSQAAPFSGKLADLLLDTPDRLRTSEWRRAEHQYEEPSRTAGENPVFKLPQLPQLPTKTTERARIPPLLQGLHQPPPLPPSGRLFPPITDGASGFEQDIRNRINSVSASHEARSKASKDSVSSRTVESNDSNDVDGEHEKDDQDDLPPAKPVSTQDEDLPSPPAADGSESQTAPHKQKGKKRKRWSDDETRDLLLGVSRFGIGKWKRILQCPDYTFHERTAVDLKDRFRVCCTPEGSKRRGHKRQDEEIGESTITPKATDQSEVSTGKSGVERPSNESATPNDVSTKAAEDELRVTHPTLVHLGINTPFAKSTRRPRRGFTSRDDENLRKGFEKYGAAWHSMRDDRELGFGARHSTDLRDRFRIRFPQIYAQAGYKTKSKAKTRRDEKEDSSKPSDAVPSQEPKESIPESRKRSHVEDSVPEVTVSDITERYLVPTSSAKQQLPYNLYQTDPGPFSFGDVSSGMPPDKDDFSNIVLNRNILQWADANNFLMANATTTATGSYATNHALDMSMHITYPNDGHIDPMATLKLPLMGVGGPSLNPNFLGNQPSSNSRLSYPSDTLAAPNPWQSSSKNASSDSLLRTPNLPTIVFPHVPAASARGAVHNLPTPADLLSGMGHGGDADPEGDFGWGPS